MPRRTAPFWAAAAAVVVVLVGSATPSLGQAFLGGGVAAFDPEISVVESGAKLDTQATVSADRKYVTLTVRAQTSQLLNLREFVFQQGGGGVVGFGGNPNANANGKPNAANVNANAVGNAAARPAVAANAAKPIARSGPLLPALARPAVAGPPPVLFQEGMRRVDVPAASPKPSDGRAFKEPRP